MPVALVASCILAGFALVRADRYAWLVVAAPPLGLATLYALERYRLRELILWFVVLAAVLNFTPALFDPQNLASESASQKALKDIPILLLAFAAVCATRRGSRLGELAIWIDRLVAAVTVLTLVMTLDFMLRGIPLQQFLVSLRYYALYPLVVVFICRLDLSSTEIRRILRGIAILGVLEGVLAVLNFYGVVGATYYQGYVHFAGGTYSRATATLGNPNNLGMFMGLAAVLLLSRSVFSGLRGRLLLVPVAAGLLVSFSKSAAIAVVIALAFQAVFGGREKIGRFRVVLIAMLGAVFLYIVVAGRLGGATSTEALLGGRTITNAAAFAQWTHNASSTLIGHGYGSLAPQVGPGFGPSQVVDNMPLFIAVEGGLLGLLVGGAVLWYGIRLLVRAHRFGRGVLMTPIQTYCVFFLLYSLIAVNFRLFPGALFFWIFVGFAVLLARREPGGSAVSLHAAGAGVRPLRSRPASDSREVAGALTPSRGAT